jgi:hypothetical protein
LDKRKKLKKLVNNKLFKNIQTPIEFKLWLGTNLPFLEEIIKN